LIGNLFDRFAGFTGHVAQNGENDESGQKTGQTVYGAGQQGIP